MNNLAVVDNFALTKKSPLSPSWTVHKKCFSYLGNIWFQYLSKQQLLNIKYILEILQRPTSMEVVYDNYIYILLIKCTKDKLVSIPI